MKKFILIIAVFILAGCSAQNREECPKQYLYRSMWDGSTLPLGTDLEQARIMAGNELIYFDHYCND